MKTNILLALVGLSPQVVTETLYALNSQGTDVDQIHIITTSIGKEKVLSKLLSEEGYFYQYLAEYGIVKDRIKFGYENVHVVKDEQGVELSDIKNEYDNECLLKLCLELARKFTREENTSVFFSLAGGRKSMSACLSFAAQVYGRMQDRLYHVLVSPEFERNNNFFFPHLEPRHIELFDEKGNPFLKSSKYAEISLAHIPFLPLSSLIDVGSAMVTTPGELLQLIVKSQKDELVISTSERKIIYKEIQCDLPPAQFALYLFFVKLKTNEVAKDGLSKDGFISLEDFFNNAKSIASIYKTQLDNRYSLHLTDSGISELSAENFNSYKSKIFSRLDRAFGRHLAQGFCISSKGERGGKLYGISYEGRKIKVV